MNDINKDFELLEGNTSLGISKLRLSNFKSISAEKPQEIELSPLTLLCGENSSGKSTLLHSILLLLQAFVSSEESGPILPLNGKMIQLSDYRRILHADSLVLDSPENDKTKLHLGVDFNTEKIQSVRGPFPSPTVVQFDMVLDELYPPGTPTVDERGNYDFTSQAFPKLDSCLIKLDEVLENYGSNPEEYKKEIEKTSMNFRNLASNRKLHVFEVLEQNNRLIVQSKEYQNREWLCEYKTEKMTESGEYEIDYDESFGGVKFSSGIPNQVSKRENLFDFVSEKMSGQVKELLENRSWLEDSLFNWSDSQFLDQENQAESISNFIDSANEINKTQMKEIIITEFCNNFKLLSDERMKDWISEVGEKDDKESEEIEKYFAMKFNTNPWVTQDYKNFYNSKKQLGLDLLQCSSQTSWEHSEIFETIFWDLSPSIVKYIKNQEPDFLISSSLLLDEESEGDIIGALQDEENRNKVLATFNSLIDRAFYEDLKVKLDDTFKEINDSIEPELDLEVDTISVSTERTQNSIDDSNHALKALRKAAEEVKYIGPLRKLENDEPKIDNFDLNIPMGLDGEYFFNFYQNVKNELIKFDKSNLISNPERYIAENEQSFFPSENQLTLELFTSLTIGDAFAQCLKEFEIADEFYTEYDATNHSVVGYIKPIGVDRHIRMKELGVGFSQLAPIILLCLSSSPGTTILLEQPELHLHPKVQQKFADFIIEMMEYRGLQIILETHSDHMLNRIRRRIAEEKLERDSSTLFENCSIYFAEREEGVTAFRKAELTKSGTYDLTDFPKGFFDQGAEDAFFILKASLEDENN